MTYSVTVTIATFPPCSPAITLSMDDCTSCIKMYSTLLHPTVLFTAGSLRDHFGMSAVGVARYYRDAFQDEMNIKLSPE